MSLREADRGERVRGRGTIRTWTLIVLLLLGIWLSIAPFALEYRSAGVPLRASVNDAVVGVAIVALALIGLGGQGRRAMSRKTLSGHSTP